jgi:hypothetical protein
MIRRRPRAQMALRIRVVGGPEDGRLVLMRPPVPRRFAHGGVPYALDRVAGKGLVAVAELTDDSTPVVAWRAWSIHERPGAVAELASGNDESWSSEGPLVASCRAHDRFVQGTDAPREPPHPAPQFRCSCGIYCTTTLDALRRAGFHEPDVYGLLAGYGRVIEHEFGYRCARVYPQAIIVNTSVRDPRGFSDEEEARRIRALRSDLSRAYRVPVVAAPAARAVAAVVGLIQGGRLPGWVRDAAPADVRLAITEANMRPPITGRRRRA